MLRRKKSVVLSQLDGGTVKPRSFDTLTWFNATRMADVNMSNHQASTVMCSRCRPHVWCTFRESSGCRLPDSKLQSEWVMTAWYAMGVTRPRPVKRFESTLLVGYDYRSRVFCFVNNLFLFLLIQNNFSSADVIILAQVASMSYR